MRTIAVACLVGALAVSARAQDAPPPEKKDLKDQVDALPAPNEIVVSARRGVPLTYAGGRDVIGPDALSRMPDANVGTALRSVPGVVVLPEQGNDSRVNVGLRGNDPRRSGLTTILVDGVPACEGPYGNTDVDALPIAFERIDRIDVIRGGASLRWGPNAAGGVVNFVTAPIPTRTTERTAARFGSDRDWSVLESIGGTWGAFGALATVVDKGGNGFRDNADFDDRDASMKFRFALDDADTLSWSVSRFTELDAKQPGGLTQAAYDHDPNQSLRHGADFRFTSNTWTADFVHDFGAAGAFEFLAWRHDGFRGLFDFRPIVAPYTKNRIQNSDFAATALEARQTWKTDVGGMPNTLFVSVRRLWEKNRELYTRTPFGAPVAPPFELDGDFRTDALSAFVEDTLRVLPNVDVALGGRREAIRMRGASRDPSQTPVEKFREYHELLPEGSVTWTFVPDAALYASAERNFLTPQYETGFDVKSDASPTLKPEHSTTYEVGTRVRALAGLQFAAALFETKFRDKLDSENLPNGTKIAVSSGRASTRGAELSANYDAGRAAPDLAGLSVYGTLTFQRSLVESGAFDGNDAPHSPRRLASWGALYEHSSGLWARVGGSYTSRQFKDPDNFEHGSADGVTGPEPAYTLWDAAIGWREHADGQGFAVRVGVSNLFDETYYRRFVSGIYPGAPRQVFVGASYTVAW